MTSASRLGETRKRAPASTAIRAETASRTVPAPMTASLPSSRLRVVTASSANGVVSDISRLVIPADSRVSAVALASS